MDSRVPDDSVGVKKNLFRTKNFTLWKIFNARNLFNLTHNNFFLIIKNKVRDNLNLKF